MHISWHFYGTHIVSWHKAPAISNANKSGKQPSLPPKKIKVKKAKFQNHTHLLDSPRGILHSPEDVESQLLASTGTTDFSSLSACPRRKCKSPVPSEHRQIRAKEAYDYNFYLVNWESAAPGCVGSAKAKSTSITVHIFKGLRLQGSNKVYIYERVG